MSRRLIDETGIPHLPGCGYNPSSLFGSIPAEVSVRDLGGGETLYSCTCGQVALWRDGVQQPDPLAELERRRRLDAAQMIVDATRRPTDPAMPVVSIDEVRAMQVKLQVAGRPHGADAIARALHVSPSTVRRRLGRLS